MYALTSPQLIEDVRLTCALACSSYTLLVWDYLLTLDDEMIYIWQSPSSVVKYFVVGNRYLNLLVHPISISRLIGVLPLHSDAACHAFALGMALYRLWSYGTVHILVLLRVWILNGRTRKITIALVAVFTIYLCTSIALLAYILAEITYDLNGTPAGTCGGKLAPFSWLIWIVELLLEICLFGLMVVTLRRQKPTSKFSRTSRLVRGFYIHAVIFLLTNTLGDISNIVVWSVFLRTPLYYIVNSFPIALVNVTGQRLAIDLRRLRSQKDVTQSEVSREVEHQLAAFDRDCVVP